MEMLALMGMGVFAGVVDAVVGGGGLIVVPTLFIALPQAPPVTLLGTNKAVALPGVLIATERYLRRVALPVRMLVPAVVCTLVGAAAGAWAATRVSPQALRLALPAVLLALLAYTVVNQELGGRHAPRLAPRAEAAVGALIGLAFGFYDGLFGPGVGVMLIFVFVRLFGYDFLHASAATKVLNGTSCATALAWFAWQGAVEWRLGVLLAVANGIGGLFGAQLALRYGSGFVRKMFIGVVLVLIAKTGVDAWRLL